MRCPFCAHLEDRVVDSRTGKNGEIIRRRRECLKCQRRFTTYERVEEILPTVVKKDGRREPFDRTKILAGIRKACQKRPVGAAAIEGLVQEIENELLELGEREVPSAWIGQRVMSRLHALDDVAYVRFASVYRQFRDIAEFMAELKGLLDGRAAPPGSDRGAAGSGGPG